MKVAVSGSHGLVGSALVASLSKDGHDVVRLVRGSSPVGSPDVSWDPMRGDIDASRLDGVEAVVNLAGAPLMGRWNDARKVAIRRSRVEGTRALSQALVKLDPLPKVMVSASASGYYGDRGSAELTEDSPPGTGFLADVAQAWEEATAPARDAGIRVVTLRSGLIMSTDGGALPVMLRPFRLGLGGRLGDGTQYMSWIDIEDHVRVIQRALADATIEGPVNAAAGSLPNAEFTRVLGQVLNRPAVLALPPAGARLLFGESADEMLLASQRLRPAKLKAAGFEFLYPDLESSLRHVLGR